MLSLISAKDWLYIGVISLVIAFGLYERAHLINEGEAKCLAREKTAADKQAAQDSKIAQDTINELQRELHGLDVPVQLPQPVRVQCYARKVPAPASVPGTARPGEPAAPAGSVPEVSRGSGSGPDLVPSLQRLANAADITSAYNRACLKELREP